MLSSGFLAFANHSGFLQAVEEAGLRVGGVMGTSAGALAGSLYCAGYTPRQVAMHLSRETPISLLRPSLAPWKGGVLSLDGVIDRLRELLPPRFEDLDREFAVGVVTGDGEHVIIDHGPLPEAVAASAAIPFIFESVTLPGPGHGGAGGGTLGPLKDGGVVDRVGLRAWRERRRLQMQAAYGGLSGSGAIIGKAGLGGAPPPPPPCLVHVINRSSPFSGFDDMASTGESNVYIVRSPKSGVNFFSLGDFESHMNAAVKRARPALEAATKRMEQNSAAAAAAGGRNNKSPERNRRLVTPA